MARFSFFTNKLFKMNISVQYRFTPLKNRSPFQLLKRELLSFLSLYLNRSACLPMDMRDIVRD